jgi:hypothetical protein
VKEGMHILYGRRGCRREGGDAKSKTDRHYAGPYARSRAIPPAVFTAASARTQAPRNATQCLGVNFEGLGASRPAGLIPHGDPPDTPHDDGNAQVSEGGGKGGRRGQLQKALQECLVCPPQYDSPCRSISQRLRTSRCQSLRLLGTERREGRAWRKVGGLKLLWSTKGADATNERRNMLTMGP